MALKINDMKSGYQIVATEGIWGAYLPCGHFCRWVMGECCLCQQAARRCPICALGS